MSNRWAVTHSNAVHHNNIISKKRKRFGRLKLIGYCLLQQETHCQKHRVQRWTVGFHSNSVPSTSWNINLWLGDLLSGSLFQTSAIVRQPDSHTGDYKDAAIHMLQIQYTHNRLYRRVSGEWHFSHSTGLQCIIRLQVTKLCQPGSESTSMVTTSALLSSYSMNISIGFLYMDTILFLVLAPCLYDWPESR